MAAIGRGDGEGAVAHSGSEAYVNRRRAPTEAITLQRHIVGRVAKRFVRNRVRSPVIPALGYKVFHLSTEDKISEADVAARKDADWRTLTLENSYLRVSVDVTSGCITSVVDKQSNAESIAPGACGNQLQLFKDTPKD
ncbi:MAG: glycoside hydrolase family 38 C-terminal domain-containing protein [Terracidiphilus sp.]